MNHPWRTLGNLLLGREKILEKEVSGDDIYEVIRSMPNNKFNIEYFDSSRYENHSNISLGNTEGFMHANMRLNFDERPVYTYSIYHGLENDKHYIDMQTFIHTSCFGQEEDSLYRSMIITTKVENGRKMIKSLIERMGEK